MDHISYVDFVVVVVFLTLFFFFFDNKVKDATGEGEISTSWMSQAEVADMQRSLGSQEAEKGHWGWPWDT